ncbi:MAG: mechanosensitive ion channel family protein [Erythrobacter sp.]|uniref:mechanosensitive ion channel family protein n=1 Tax=Erythrobacter sp. TaxID=1042 RepID=UPI003C717E6D
MPAKSSPNVYEVDTINSGLPDPGRPLDLETPQALIESFLDAGFEEEWDRAATALDLSELPPAEQARLGPNLAKQTFEILHRSILLDWRSLSDRPDAREIIASSEDPLAGETRRSITLAHLEAEDRDYSFRIARLKTPDGEPVWMISRQTMQNIPALYQQYGPTQFERSLPDWLRQQAFWSLAWWEVIAMPIVLLVAFLAAALVYVAIRRFRARQDEQSLSWSIARAVHVPAALVALAGTFAILRQFVFNFSGTISQILDPLQITLFVVAILAVVITVIDTIISFAADRRTEKLEDPSHEESRDYFTKLDAGRRMLTVLAVLVGTAVVLVQSDITSTLGFTLLASAGVLGLVLVFAARQALGDLMASIQIAFAKTARIGDAVYFDGQWCYVERIGFTHLRLRTWDERRLMVPVADFVGETFENWTKTDPSVMTHVELVLDHRADVDALREEFQRFVEDSDDVIDKDDAKIQVVDQSAEGKVVRFLARAREPKTGWTMQCEVREAMMAAASRLDENITNDVSPAFLPREREVEIRASGD